MQKKVTNHLFLSIFFIVFLSACVRPASKAPISEPKTSDAIETPLPVDQEVLNATLTAQAIMEKFNQPTALGKVVDPTSTVENLQPTSTESALPQNTPTTIIIPPTPVMTKPETYTIHAGEYIYCLARRFDVDPGDLLSLNGLTTYSILTAGMTLKIPTTGSYPGSRSLLPHPDTYTVGAGETIYHIACKFGDVYPEYIIAVNDLVAPYDVTTGQILQIP